jgi:hypothetical protein|tara:strand:- start:406 stop:810 length:405 start_codon:yes stop_codon:yes gene_type:complete
MLPIISTLMPIVTDVIGRFLPENPQKRAEAEREITAALTEHLAKIDLAQIEVNKVEAASRSVWTSGWRPCVGWVCAAALGYTYVLQPILVFILAQTGHLVEMPALDIGGLMPILMGMLGLGGLRSYEKVKGVAK